MEGKDLVNLNLCKFFVTEEKTKVERALSDLAISMYNLESIRLIALLKVDKTDFESFRDTREGYYRSLAARIT